MKLSISHIAQKYFYITAATLLVGALPVTAQVNNNPATGVNLITNGGFENGSAPWKIPANTAEVVHGVAHTGNYSLYYSNQDRNQYKLFTQPLKLQPGDVIEMSAWVKGENLGSGRGAGFFAESHGNSKFLGGAYPRTSKGTFDWTQIKANYTVPPAAQSTTFGLYFERTVTGQAWFDDVSVTIIAKPAAIESYLVAPHYRGMVKTDDYTPWKYALTIRPQSDWAAGDITIKNTLIDAQGKVLLHKEISVAVHAGDTGITITPPQNLAVGEYTLTQTITDSNGKVQLTQQSPIRVVAQMPKVYIDPEGFTVVNGQRFFPMGVYLGGTGDTDDANLQQIKEGGFNTVLTYSYGKGKGPEEYLNRAQQHDLKVIYSIKDMYPGIGNYGDDALDIATQYVKELKDKPALLAWYTNDELHPEWLDKLEKTYKMVTRLDANHPAFQVLSEKGNIEKYYDVTDTLGLDPYPVGNPDLTITSTYTGFVKDAVRGARGIWMVPQIMDWAVYRKNQKPHPPTLDDMRNQAYQSIISGATGLIWYSYYDLRYKQYPREQNLDMDLFAQRWKDVTAMAKEIDQITPAILANKKVLLDVPAKAEVEVGAWQQGDKLALLFANPYYDTKSITFALPQGWKMNDADQGQIKSTFANGKATFTLPSVGSGVFYLVKGPM